MKVVVTYVGSSLLGPLKNAERDINRAHKLDLHVAAYNFGSPLSNFEWTEVDKDLGRADVVFVIHVMDGENASRLLDALKRHQARHRAVVVINCMPQLMRRTRMGRLQFSTGDLEGRANETRQGEKEEEAETRGRQALRLLGTVASWVGRQTRRGPANKNHGHGQYLKLIEKLPGALRFVPAVGVVRDVKNYLFLFAYFLQPTPVNVRAMLLFALKQYVPDRRLKELKIDLPEAMPAVAIYHPDAAKLFESLEKYRKWYLARASKAKVRSANGEPLSLDPDTTVGLLLMRPQVVSQTTKHYDTLIRAIEAEGLSVIPAISTLMDNREACEKFFLNQSQHSRHTNQKPGSTDNRQLPTANSLVSQVVSLTGFSFVGGPAMNDSRAAAKFLRDLNRPYRSAVSLDMQTIEAWRESQTGLNPVQLGMQVAIPEIDGATEPFVYGGIPAKGFEPDPLDDRCLRFARRLRRWQRLQTRSREQIKLALVLFCFPPNKGNIGTAADLDVFPSLWDTLHKLKSEGYAIDMPDSADRLRDMLLKGNSGQFASAANVAYRMDVEEYRRLCPYVDEVDREWGTAPGRINSFGGTLLIQGVALSKVFIGVQPTFGYEGDPMRLMMARSGAPHHGFMAFYTYLSRVFNADAVVHIGTHGALEFMPGKQVGLSGECWPDRLIGELPHVYLYSVNNPSEGSIAKRRSYAELVSYLTPPIENAGLYKDLAVLKDLVMAYRQTSDERERERLFDSIEEYREGLKLGVGPASSQLRA